MKVNTIRIFNFEVENLSNGGCSNGQYPKWKGVTGEGKPIGGTTCQCMRGCSNTDELIWDYDNPKEARLVVI